MAGITLEQAEDRLSAYMKAELAALDNQAYEIAGRRLTRANLKEIRDGIVHWQELVTSLSDAAASRRRIGYVRHGF